jgi:hypothetical protein
MTILKTVVIVSPTASSGTRIAHHAARPHRRMYMQARHMIPHAGQCYVRLRDRS